LRQGKTVAETQELLRSTMMLSKLGALDSATATDDLTSTLNSYNLSANEAASVVDKLVAVDNVAATSAGELAVALRYTAAAAQESGVTLDQLISYIGVISSTSRQSAESIGQAMKTMFTRMQDIKAGKIDEDGLGINNVETALARVNIKLRDNQLNFRDMGTVLEEVAAKWNTLNEMEQAN
jgi:TP901 family phage tail tape measure protein